MARAKLTDVKKDLISDEGAILWSIVKGEQLEFPITLEFLKNVVGYTYEAVIIEAESEGLRPGKYPRNTVKGGAQTKLPVRLPKLDGEWDDGRKYFYQDWVTLEGEYWRCVVSETQEKPGTGADWVQDVPTTLHVQFPFTVGEDWKTQPDIARPSYGFFELRVTEPGNSVFQKTWKPVRGLVQVLFSPTDIVPD